ncbi:MAG: signal recognition particle protein [Bacilli bacterium]|nr:signal recognition particle protein [Mollicutes bacterium]MDD6469371.1 signal recognition particle protein [Bacilli bacterium]MDY2724085.1 signal recognition particle protein [Candidatus Onthovivens sp.]MCI7040457.1 signal recognition particle protein [Mollicutes bacterium]MCI7225416.1 signal recognition particle protein [Mollicutes bacterium]
MAFEALQEKFSRIVKTIKGESKLTEKNMEAMLKEVRIALLEADVNYKVVKVFVSNVKEKALGQQVYTKLNPSEMVIKIVKDELVELLGSDRSELAYNKNKPTIIMLVGLQGSGKTTTAAKLANLMKNKLKKKVLLAACDVYRPAAIDQLAQLASELKVDLVNMGDKVNPVDIALKAKEKAYNDHYDVLIIDTAGRLQIDEPLMEELKNIKEKVKPDEILLLTDALAGQDTVNVAKTFNDTLGLTGDIMSKMDGDSRGGAALSISYVTGVPIKFIGTGEKITDLDIFYPERMAERILGMGDVLSLIDKVQENIDEKEAKKAVNKMMGGKFTLDDMLDQMKQVKKLGSLKSLMKLIPGAPKISDEQFKLVEDEMKNFEVIINSMTKEERENPEILKNSRKCRIAKGSGKTNADVNRVLKKYEEMKKQTKLLKEMKKGGRFPSGF